MRRTLFISDLHLGAERPELLTAFETFLAGPARGAAALYILGDLFEYWAGDDDIDTPPNRLVADSLRALADTGTQIHFMPGNRDFLIGEAFAAAAGLTLLPSPSLVTIDGRKLLLCHGDELCTDDVVYQAYRKQVRDPAWLAGFLARPLAERKAFIESLRQRSEMDKQDKAASIMDVNPAAVEDTLRQHGYPDLIHGHTHRPACHRHAIDGHTCTRWVLADWPNAHPYLVLDEQGLHTE